MAQSVAVIKCMILTLRSQNILLPSASVAEMVSAEGAIPTVDLPSWFVAKMRWHGVDVPIVSYEAASGEKIKEVNQNTQIAMIYTAGSDKSRYPYIGLVVSGVPHVTQFTREQIIIDPESLLDVHLHPMVVKKTRINGAAVSILDIDGIESMIAKAEVYK